MSLAQDYFKTAQQRGRLPVDATLTDAYAFGSRDALADALGQLVVHGIKRATASGYEMYQGGPDDPLPRAGSYHVILGRGNQPLCVILTDCVCVKPFNLVTAEDAYLSGEDDRSLAAWRAGYAAYFQQAYPEEAGIPFDSATCHVVLEYFHVVVSGD